jgi:ribonuclease HI
VVKMRQPPDLKQKQLFASAPIAKPRASDAIFANIDGGARGNPGPAGYGVVIRDAANHVTAEISKFLGHGTNNFAEYSALLAALDHALKNGHKSLHVFSDSELLVKQMKGEYQVRSAELRPLYEQARAASRKLESFTIQHVRREQNREADKLANQAMDEGR